MASLLSILKTVLNLNHNCMHVTSCETATVTVHRFAETFEQMLGSGEKGHSESGKKGHFSVREKGPTHQRLFYSDYWLLATVESSFTGFHS